MNCISIKYIIWNSYPVPYTSPQAYILHFYRVEIKNLIRGFDVVDNDEGDDAVMVCLQEDSINSILEKL